MPRKLKFYGWTGMRHECPPAPNGGRQTREIVAAHSKAEVSRISGYSLSELNWDLDETANDVELWLMNREPGVVFWIPLYANDRELSNWRKA